MPDLRKFIQGQKFSLAGSGMSSSETSLTLQSFKLPDGTTTITTTNIGSKAYGTLEPGTSREEHVSFTTITQNLNGTATRSGVTRGLRFVDPYDEVSANKKAHSGGSIFVISNTVAFYGDFANKSNDETVGGTWTFSSVPSSSAAPVSGTDLVTKSYADALSMTGTGVSQNRVVVAGVAGETLAAGDLVYLINEVEWRKTDADIAASVQSVMLGIAQGSGTLSSFISGGVLLFGVDATRSGLLGGTTYYASNTPGGISTTAGTNERAIGIAKSGIELYFDPYFFSTIILASTTAKGIVEEATQAEVTAGTAVGATGARLFVNPSTLVSGMPTRKIYFNIGLQDTQFDISNPSGTTFRYTDDLTAARSGITATTVPIGTILNINVAAFASGNRGTFTVTGSGDNYFEVTNAAGVVESNKLIGSGADRIQVGGTTWTKPATLKWVHIQAVASGGGGGSTSGEGGGGAGEFGEAFVSAASLGATETVTVGKGGNIESNGNNTVFGSLFTLIAGLGTTTDVGGKGGGASYVDANGHMRIRGGNGQSGDTSENIPGGGGVSFFGGSNTHSGAGGGAAGEGPGAWGSGGPGWSGSNSHGATGVLIITEHYV